jgi:hypothetical protein
VYKLDVGNKELKKMVPASFSEMELRERFDIQEWVDKQPEILGEGEDFLIIAKEYILPTRIRLDLLALDRMGSLVIVELKRDDSGKSVTWQAITYASYCSKFQPEEICQILADRKGLDIGVARNEIEDFVEVGFEEINAEQRIVLMAREFDSDTASAVLWLRDYELDIQCVRLQPYKDEGGSIFISAGKIIPLPEAEDYILGKERKQKRVRAANSSTRYSHEQAQLNEADLANAIAESLNRPSPLSARLRCVLDALCGKTEFTSREELMGALMANGLVPNNERPGTYLSNVSQFLTKPTNGHLRQLVEFDSAGTAGARKDGYRMRPEWKSAYDEAIRIVTIKTSDAGIGT